jgi:hypothetical protein
MICYLPVARLHDVYDQHAFRALTAESAARSRSEWEATRMPTKTAQECLAAAANCESMAAEALTNDDRITFLMLAAKWRSPAEEQREIDGRTSSAIRAVLEPETPGK